jgi:HAD superfamily hydrolase (TIGR01509 family)
VAEAAGQASDSQREEDIDRRAGENFSALNLDPRVLPGATELLNALDVHRQRWAIATSSRREQVGASVNALNLSRPPLIIDGSNVEHAKPAPDLLLLAARELDIAPSHGCYVGDAVWDMRAAAAAGMPVIGVVSGSATAAELIEAGALFTVDDLTQLVPLVTMISPPAPGPA